MKVSFIDLQSQYYSIKKEIDDSIQRVLHDTAFSAGPYVKEFETNFAIKHNAKFCIGVNSGTAALHASLMALGIGVGDEVIVPTNTFFATPEAVSLVGATPVFIDCELEYANINTELIEKAVTSKTKAIIAVHLYGQSAKIDIINNIAKKYNIFFIEDAAQAHLAEFNGSPIGTAGDCSCFSFYCGKNLGAYGEGGAVLTNDENLYNKIMMIRDHGSSIKYHHEVIGHNYRMAGIQGAILNVKLKYLEDWTNKRRKNADIYKAHLNVCSEICLPYEMQGAKHVYHLFVIKAENRDELAQYLLNKQIYTGLHYPIPCHLQKAYNFLGYKVGDMPISEKLSKEILSLPMSEQLEEDQIIYVANNIKEFYA
ncbi:MAG: DegT/DnrJ/EryC1/StrS family aminotransferase [Bacteroidetes bacterium]|nr:DegT/DnrJ/EryC1/StrS family aminotransferase [Bacteroidota bacterium]